MRVRIIEHTPNPEQIVANAARLCYSDSDIDGLFEKFTDEENKEMIQRLLDLGHFSPLEHVSFTFAIEGVSRALTHQLVRHRTGKFSQKSQRYVNESEFDYIVPESIANVREALEEYMGLMEKINESYDTLVNMMGIPKEDARYILPNATETKLVMTMDGRNLLNFFKHRCCNRAQKEIRDLADEMLRQCKEIAPMLFSKAGASCTYGRCSEGKFTCGSPRKGI